MSNRKTPFQILKEQLGEDRYKRLCESGLDILVQWSMILYGEQYEKPSSGKTNEENSEFLSSLMELVEDAKIMGDDVKLYIGAASYGKADLLHHLQNQTEIGVKIVENYIAGVKFLKSS